jgi:TetR/AcrR family transcriptional regulator
MILKAARTVFARKGYDGASTREVAELARVNNAMIYYHFKDKQRLYRAVLADSFSAFELVWDHTLFRSGASVRAKVSKFIEEFIRFQRGNEEFRRIMSMEFAVCSENYRWLADRYFAHSYRKLAQLLREGMRKGELKRFDPVYAVPGLVGMIIHSFILRPIAGHVVGKKPDLSVGRFSTFVSDMFFDGLQASAHRRG